MSNPKEWKVGDLCLCDHVIGLAVIVARPTRMRSTFVVKSTSIKGWQVQVTEDGLRAPTKRAIGVATRMMVKESAEVKRMQGLIKRAQKPPRQ